MINYRRILVAALCSAALLLACTILWNSNGAPAGIQPFDSRVAAFEQSGEDAGRGNLVAIQPWLVPTDYSNAETLLAKLDGYFMQARARHWFNRKTIVVLPEYIGSWLVAAGERASVYRETRVQNAMITIALSHPISFMRWYASAPDVDDKAKWAVFTLKSQAMAREYQAVFGALARNYGVTLVAGSIVLPEPRIANGRIAVNPGGSLYNVSALFTPDGRVATSLIVKSFPIEEEKAFASPGHAGDIPVFATLAGRLAVLVCADSWYRPVYLRIASKRAELLAIPSFSTGDRAWARSWTGYDGTPVPPDVDRADIGKITEGQAWLKYSMGGRAGASGIKAGVNVFLRGDLWDLGSDGSTTYFRDGRIARVQDRHGAVLFDEWL